MDPREQLAQRPTFEEAEKGYLALLADLRDIVDAQQPGLRWNEAEPVRSTAAAVVPPSTASTGRRTATTPSTVPRARSRTPTGPKPSTR